MARYLLLLRDTGTFDEGLSPSDIQAIIERYATWSAGLRARGKIAGGEKLKDGEGRVLRAGASGLDVTDGPYAEAKEVLGGYFLVTASDYDEALAIARTCPHVDFGSIEIREIHELGE